MLFIRQASVSKSILSSVKKSIYCPIRGQKSNRWFSQEYKLDQYMGYQIQAHQTILKQCQLP